MRLRTAALSSTSSSSSLLKCGCTNALNESVLKGVDAVDGSMEAVIVMGNGGGYGG